MTLPRTCFPFLLALALAGCGGVTAAPDAAPADAAPADAATDAPEAPPDGPAPDAPAPPPTGDVLEPISAAGRLSGGGMVLDVQLGHPIPQSSTTGGGRTFQGGAAINP